MIYRETIQRKQYKTEEKSYTIWRYDNHSDMIWSEDRYLTEPTWNNTSHPEQKSETQTEITGINRNKPC